MCNGDARVRGEGTVRGSNSCSRPAPPPPAGAASLPLGGCPAKSPPPVHGVEIATHADGDGRCDRDALPCRRPTEGGQLATGRRRAGPTDGDDRSSRPVTGELAPRRSIDRSIQTLYTIESFAYRVFHFPLCSQSAVYIGLIIRFALNHVWCSRSRAVSSQACAR